MIGAVLGPLGGVVSSIIGGVGSLAVGVAKTAGKLAGFGGKDDPNTDEGRKKRGMKAKGEGSDMSEEEMNKKMDKVGSSDKTSDDEDEEKPKLFGGLDLAGMKSQIDGPMGPPEPETPVKGGVYKQIFAVNKSMLASLLRIEETMRMLLSVEYERIQQMISGDTEKDRKSRDKKLKEGDTDPKAEKKKGLFGRAAAGVGSMLGGAYGKVKGGLGSTLFKALGLTALVVLFKKYEDELAIGTQAFLKNSKELFDYFNSDDFNWGDFGTMAKNKITELFDAFLPILQEKTMDFLNFVYAAVKEIVLGPSGEKAIKQASKKITANKGSIQKIADMGVDVDAFEFGLGDNSAFKKSGGTDQQRSVIMNSLDDTVTMMTNASRESDGRVQWTGISGDLSGFVDPIFGIGGKQTYTGLLNFLGASQKVLPSDVLNSRPIIDGVVGTMADLDVLGEPGGLMSSGGMTINMSDPEREGITESLKQRSLITGKIEMKKKEQKGYQETYDMLTNPESPTALPKDDMFAMGQLRAADVAQLQVDELTLELATLMTKDLGQDFTYLNTTLASKYVKTDGTSPSSEALLAETKLQTIKTIREEFAEARNRPPGVASSINASTNNYLSETINHNVDLAAHNGNRTVQTFWQRQLTSQL